MDRITIMGRIFRPVPEMDETLRMSFAGACEDELFWADGYYVCFFTPQFCGEDKSETPRLTEYFWNPETDQTTVTIWEIQDEFTV